MQISERTIKYASDLGLELEIDENELIITGIGWDDEYLARYEIDSDGLFYRGTCFNQDNDMPCWIQNEAAFKSYLPEFVKLAHRYGG